MTRVTWNPGNPELKSQIIQEFLGEENTPLSYGELWSSCKHHCSKTTFNLYLGALVKDGLVERIRRSRKRVMFRLKLEMLGWDDAILKEIRKSFEPRFSVDPDELQRSLEGLKEEEKRLKLAEILSKIVGDFDARISDMALQRIRRSDLGKSASILNAFERRSLYALVESFVSGMVNIYAADPSFVDPMLHVLMRQRKEVEFEENGRPRLYSMTYDWLREIGLSQPKLAKSDKPQPPF